jgi:hypothetical protein
MNPRTPWLRDFALVGGITGAAAPYTLLRSVEYSLFAAAGGAASGALLGLFSAWLLSGRARKWRRFVFIPLGLAVGALWGGAAGLATGLSSYSSLLGLSLVFSAIAGTLQLGWFWLAYAVRRVNGRSTVPVVVVASLLSATLGWAGLLLLNVRL